MATSSTSTCILDRYDDLYREQKPIVWLVKVKGYIGKNERIETHATAFCVKDDGFLITCAHIFDGLSRVHVEAKQLDMESYFSTCVFKKNTSWDLCLLKVEGVKDCQTGKLAINGAFDEGEILLTIANPFYFVGTFGLAIAAYPCLEENVDIPRDDRTCLKYKSKAMNKTPPYRIMGHRYNTRVFNETPDDKYTYERDLHPLLPIIQCGKLVGHVYGGIGSPVFNTQGEIVGIMVTDDDEDQLALHVTLIRQFLEDNLWQQQASSKKRKKTSFKDDGTRLN